MPRGGPGKRRAIRPIRIEGDVAYVPLTRGFTAVIDVDDVPLVEGRNWYAHKGTNTWYGAARIGGQIVLLHRFLMGADNPAGYDHEDRDGLNCRRSNLRAATTAQNGQNSPKRRHNTSGHKGVFTATAGRSWFAQIKSQNRLRYLGSFKTKAEAKAAYDAAAMELHGEFRRT